jgi:CheY-like chemotaxis protein
MLSGKDYEIIHAYEALSKLEAKKPDLIILDILLGAINGDTLFIHLKGIPEYTSIPIIMISDFPSNTFENLKEIYPSLVFLDKTYLAKDRLREEVAHKLIEGV